MVEVNKVEAKKESEWLLGSGLKTRRDTSMKVGSVDMELYHGRETKVERSSLVRAERVVAMSE